MTYVEAEVAAVRAMDSGRWFVRVARAWTIGFGLVAVLAVASAAAARADEVDDLREHVQQLQQQMNFLQNQVPGANAGGSNGVGTVAAQQVVQMQQIHQQMSQLQG